MTSAEWSLTLTHTPDMVLHARPTGSDGPFVDLTPSLNSFFMKTIDQETKTIEIQYLKMDESVVHSIINTLGEFKPRIPEDVFSKAIGILKRAANEIAEEKIVSLVKMALLFLLEKIPQLAIEIIEAIQGVFA